MNLDNLKDHELIALAANLDALGHQYYVRRTIAMKEHYRLDDPLYLSSSAPQKIECWLDEEKRLEQQAEYHKMNLHKYNCIKSNILKLKLKVESELIKREIF